uniref:Nif3-like dinuclear metal center hexameric protein n=1 Tax=Ningiella ruwaisensis TaxID=2364274 RepID=UPI00109FB546|nr:Nif3-like dinuclear metal center hexameric protein [Ningiella ruwaisensis]
MQRNKLIKALSQLLSPNGVKDYCPNGLQVEGKTEVKHIVTGVTASLALIEKAISLQADAILVHHGYFWKNEAYNIVGMKKRRIQQLLAHDINLLAYHLPIDIHPEFGNNAQLAKVLGLKNVRPLENIEPLGIVMQGELPEPESHQAFSTRLSCALSRDIASVGNKDSIQHLAWCTGGGQAYIDAFESLSGESMENDTPVIDAFISGEISEQTTHSARELGIDYFAAGHHATERYGVKAVGEYLAAEFGDSHGLKVSFVDIDNPA